MGLASYVASTALRSRDVKVPLNPMNRISVVSPPPSVSGKYSVKLCTPLNLEALGVGLELGVGGPRKAEGAHR